MTTRVSDSTIAGNPYSRAVNAPETLSFAAIDLPTGLILGQSGVISGVPVQSGRFTVTLFARGIGGTRAAVLDLTVIDPPTPFITSELTVTLETGIPFSYQITASSPTPILSYSATGLPTGLTVNTSSGVISGTPTSVNDDPVVTTFALIGATNSVGAGQQQSLALILQQRPVITSSLTALTFPQGQAITPYTITASKSPISFGASPLPSGLTADPVSGVVSGTPVLNGNFVPPSVFSTYADVPTRATLSDYIVPVALVKSGASNVMYQIKARTGALTFGFGGQSFFPFFIEKIDSSGVVTKFFESPIVASGTLSSPVYAENIPPYTTARVGAASDFLGNVYVSTLGGQQSMYPSFSTEGFNMIGVTKIPFDTVGTAALFNSPTSVVVDANDNIYVADKNNNTIRKIVRNNNTNVTTTFAGTVGPAGTSNGTGSVARFNSPQSLTVDSSGNVYVADTNNHAIRKITPAAVVTTLAGFAGTSGSADGTGTSARFNSPLGVTVDSSGNVYVADTNNHTIRKVTSAGVVTTLAGTAGSSGNTDGTGSAARFNLPQSVAVDSSGNVYVADSGNLRIRKITSAGVVTTVVDSSTGNPVAAYGTGIAVDSSGNIFFVDIVRSNLKSGVIKKITPAGVLTPFCGESYAFNNNQPDSKNGFGTSLANAPWFFQPRGLAFDASGNLYTAESGSHIIRKITSGAVASLIAGCRLTPGSSDGDILHIPGPFYNSLCCDSSNNLYSGGPQLGRVDTGSFLAKLTPAGDIFIWNPAVPGFVPFTGPILEVPSYPPPVPAYYFMYAGYFSSLACGPSGSFYAISKTYNFSAVSVVKITLSPTFNATTLVPSLPRGYFPVPNSRINSYGFPSGYTIFVSSLEKVFFSLDGLNIGNVVFPSGSGYEIIPPYLFPSGVTFMVTQGAQTVPYRAVKFSNLEERGLVVDSSENIYTSVYTSAGGIKSSITRSLIPPTGTRILRTPTFSSGAVTTFVGAAGSSGFVDGTGSAARFSSPQGLKLSSSGDLYVADTGNNAIRKITSAGVVSTFATGIPAPKYLTIAPSGNVYVTDSVNSLVRKITPNGTVSIHAQTNQQFPAGITVVVEPDSSETLYVKCQGPGMTKILESTPPVGQRITVVNEHMYLNDSTGAPSDLIALSGNSFYVIVNIINLPSRLIKWNGTTQEFGSSANSQFDVPYSVPLTGNFTPSMGVLGMGVEHIAVSSDGGLTHTNSFYNSVSETSTLSNILLQPVTNRDGKAGSTDGLSNAASFNNPTGVATSPNFIFVSDTGNHTIRKISRAVNPVTTNSLLTANNGALTGSASLSITITN